MKWHPEKLTIFSTLVGLLNAKSHDFGGNVSTVNGYLLRNMFQIVARLVGDLNHCFENEEFDIALRIVC